MYGLVTVNLNGPDANAADAAQSLKRSSVPGPSSPSTTAAGRARNPIDRCSRNRSASARPTSRRHPPIGATK